MSGPNPKSRTLEWTRPVQFVKGIGPQRAELLEKIGIRTLADLLFFFPRKYHDYSNLCAIGDLVADQPASVIGTIDDLEPSISSHRHAVYALIKDERDWLRAVWFNQPYLLPKLRQGQRVLLRGTPKKNQKRW